MIEDLGQEEGLEDIEQPTKIALIDADTLVFAVAVANQYPDEVLAREFYSAEEWDNIIHDPQYDEAESCIWRVNIADCVEKASIAVEEIKAEIFAKDVELYFSAGRNFRHIVHPMYKANRTGRYPPGLLELKSALLERYKGEICDGIEADDAVVYLKRTQPDKYILCAVDKDVYRSVPGKHWNYYSSTQYNIPRKWVETTKEEAQKFPYIQTLTGDRTDNIMGCPGIGPKRAEKIVQDGMTPAAMWKAVCDAFESKNLTIKDAIRDMRLVNMHQVTREGAKWVWNPWTPPTSD